MESDALFIGHQACEKCGSSDACALYSDQHTHCFSCGAHRSGSGVEAKPAEETKVSNNGAFVPITTQAITARGLHEATCRKWGYGVGMARGKPVQVANYYDDGGNLVAQKIRTKDKEFSIRGDPTKMTLYGQWLWRDGGNIIVVTEGEIDALTVSQLQDLKWPVVSVPNGAQGAAKAVRKSLEFLEKYERVVFMFDNDEPGKKAAQECAALMSPGKARVASLPAKDPNELLTQGKGAAVISAMWDAKVFRPDGIIDSDGALQLLSTRQYSMPIASYPHSTLESMVRGLLPRQVVVICSGSGQGKTEFTRELAYSCIQQGLKVGYVALEESVDRTAIGLIGVHLNRRLHLENDPQQTEGFTDAWKQVVKDRVYFYDHFGSTDGDHLIAKLRYLRVACGVDVIVLDHISIVVSGLEELDERRAIDNIMTKLRSLAEETGVAVYCISHLKRPQGLPHEEGGRTSLAQLRGSAAIGQLSDIAIGLERNQQNPETCNYTMLRVLKNRRTGETGPAGWMFYDKVTGRMTECGAPESVAAEQAAGDDF